MRITKRINLSRRQTEKQRIAVIKPRKNNRLQRGGGGGMGERAVLSIREKKRKRVKYIVFLRVFLSLNHLPFSYPPVLLSVHHFNSGPGSKFLG